MCVVSCLSGNVCIHQMSATIFYTLLISARILFPGVISISKFSYSSTYFRIWSSFGFIIDASWHKISGFSFPFPCLHFSLLCAIYAVSVPIVPHSVNRMISLSGVSLLTSNTPHPSYAHYIVFLLHPADHQLMYKLQRE